MHKTPEAYIPFSAVKRALMKDSEFKRIYDERKPEFALRRAVLAARHALEVRLVSTRR